MDFVEAMERLKRAVMDDEIAAATGVSTNTIRRSRADPETRNYRPAPGGWECALVQLARAQGEYFMALAKDLEALCASDDLVLGSEASPNGPTGLKEKDQSC